MYLPKHFEQPDHDAMARLLAAHPLATLAWNSADGPTAEHLPLMWERGAGDGPLGTLRGHVARANPVWREAAGAPVLAAFQGPQAYITPSWYPSKAASAKVVPTWNYAVVHAHGTLRVTEDAAWLRALVGRLTDVHEASRAHRWQVDDAPADYIEQMLRAIVGIEIELVSLQGKWKVSQNRSAADRAGVAAGLESLDSDDTRAMAGLVRSDR
jgi:transcriptional regulator